MPRTRTALTIGDWEKLAYSIDEEATAEAPQLQPIHESLRQLRRETTQ